MSTPFDGDSSTGDVSKALLEGQDDDGSDSGSESFLHRPRRRRVVKIIGIIATTLFCALATFCFIWHIATLNIKTDGAASQKMSTTNTQAPTLAAGISEFQDAPDKFESGAVADRFSDWKDCGSSADEARAKGCYFDLMLSTWVHEDCRDTDLMEKYITNGHYRWYRDRTFEDEFSDEEVRRGDHHTAAVSKEQHFAHCAYSLEKTMKALTSGKPVGRSLISDGHTVHCTGILTDRTTLKGNVTVLVIDFDKCGTLSF